MNCDCLINAWCSGDRSLENAIKLIECFENISSSNIVDDMFNMLIGVNGSYVFEGIELDYVESLAEEYFICTDTGEIITIYLEILNEEDLFEYIKYRGYKWAELKLMSPEEITVDNYIFKIKHCDDKDLPIFKNEKQRQSFIDGASEYINILCK